MTAIELLDILISDLEDNIDDIKDTRRRNKYNRIESDKLTVEIKTLRSWENDLKSMKSELEYEDLNEFLDS